MRYTHLTQDERYQIYEYRLQKKSYKEIGTLLNRHPTTIKREILRNHGGCGWRPLQAQSNAKERRRNSNNARRIKEEDWQSVQYYLHQDWSPEQIIERLALVGTPIKISHETIYQRIYKDKRKGGKLYKLLRCQKTYRKRYASGQQRRGMIKNRISIDERPAIVDQKIRIGDIEGDTVIGKNQQGVIITLVDRVSRYTFAKKVKGKHAKGVTQGIIDLLKPHQHRCHTITVDNGKEFAFHEQVAAQLQVDVYFAHPYHSWERGLNENTNGLLRQYFPKKINLKKITEKELQNAILMLNNRPRKCLGYKTPYEVFHDLDILPLKSIIGCTS